MSLIWILIVLLLGAFVYLLLGNGGNVVVRRQFDAYAAKYGKYLTRAVIVPVLIFAVLAVLMRDIILTPYLLVIAAAVGYYRVKQVIAAEGVISPRDIAQLVLAFRGAFQIVPATFNSLKLVAGRVEEPLCGIVLTTVETYYASGGRPERAFDFMREHCNDPLLDQFVYILEMSESATDEAVIEALDGLHVRLQRHEELEREVETGLSGITGQTGFMQGLAVLIAFAIGAVPNMRSVYTSSMTGRLGYIVLVGVIMGTSYLIERRNQELKEQIL